MNSDSTSHRGRVSWLPRAVAAAAIIGLGAAGTLVVAADPFSDRLPLRIELGARSISKAPFLIAADQRLFEKHGLDVDLRMPPADFGGGLGERGWTRRVFDRVLDRYPRTDMVSNGATPDIVEMVTNADARRMKVIASTDCIVRGHVVARRGITRLEELKGKRIGVTGLMHNITAFTALELARRMGWDPVHDISIVLNGDNVEMLERGTVDAIIAPERDYAAALEKGFPVLLDTRTWGDLPVGGNSVQVTVSWLRDEANREAARRFLRAFVEGVVLFHENRALTVDVLQRWNGVSRPFAEVMYDEAAIPRKPYPCYAGIKRTMEVYDSHAMRAYTPEDFYDDSLLKELDASGFIDRLYAEVSAATSAR
jgi:ABC-type nitrate/sulfonate/bicarbonate transport system substrate-binding protein